MIVCSTFDKRKRVARTGTGLEPRSFVTITERCMANVHQESHYHPNIDWEYQIQPRFGICIHPTIEAGLNTKV